MNNKKIKEMTMGALLASVFGAIGIINLYTGSALDIIFAYVMAVGVAWYTHMYNEKSATLVVLTSTVVLFFIGEMFFTIYAFFTMFLGIAYIHFVKKMDIVKTKRYLMVVAFIKNALTLMLFSFILGMDITYESREIYKIIITFLPMLKSDLLEHAMMYILWLILSYCDVSIVINYTNFLLSRIMKKR